MLINNLDTIKLENGFSQYEIDTDLSISFKIECNIDSNVYIRIVNAKDINIEGTFIDGCNCSILFWNDSNSDIQVLEKYVVNNNCDITLSYGECNGTRTKRDVELIMSGENSSSSINSASLVNTFKQYDIKVINDAINTRANIRNYAVVLEEGKLMIDAVGKINKGAKKSSSHQVSRALSFAKGQSTTILPELLIDENDVQASHAMSIGKVDERQLYYMMSRGLSMNECTTLISKGYLLPITDSIQDETLKNTLINELERKIDDICLM